MSGDETVWDVACKATEHARRENEKKGGLGFWYHVMNSVWKPAYTVQSAILPGLPGCLEVKANCCLHHLSASSCPAIAS